MEYKAVICDLDGTLLGGDHKISEYTQNVIKKAVKKGIKFYIATGRHHLDAKVFRDILGLDSFLISSNGAKVHDKNNKEIFSMTIPKETSLEIINLTKDSEVHKNIYSGDDWIVEKPLDMAEDFHKESSFSYKIDKYQDFNKNKITKFFFISPDEEKIYLLEKKLKEKLKDKVEITLSLETCLEIMSLGVSKGEAIKKLAEIEGLKLEEIIAFGDGLNDFEMLSTVGKGFIMGNHNPRLKQLLPKHEVIEANTQDGVAKKIEELFLR